MADGIERLVSLKNQLDLTDPDWAFDVTVAGESVNVELRPKDLASAVHRPIGITVELSSNDAAVTRQVEAFMRYGRPVHIPGESVIRFEADLPGNLAEVIGHSGTPAVSLTKSEDESRGGWPSELTRYEMAGSSGRWRLSGTTAREDRSADRGSAGRTAAASLSWQ